MPLLTSWTDACFLLVPDADTEVVAGTGADLLRRYAEPPRRYHTATHVAEMVAALDRLLQDPVEHALGVLVAWFHDAVYEPARADNEAASAGVARRACAALGVDTAYRSRVVDLVLATADHQLPQEDRLAAAVHDADLWILSAPVARYEEYSAAVRAEYAHVPEREYAAARSAILSALARRPRLYAADLPHREWTGAARANLARELARLA